MENFRAMSPVFQLIVSWNGSRFTRDGWDYWWDVKRWVWFLLNNLLEYSSPFTSFNPRETCFLYQIANANIVNREMRMFKSCHTRFLYSRVFTFLIYKDIFYVINFLRITCASYFKYSEFFCRIQLDKVLDIFVYFNSRKISMYKRKIEVEYYLLNKLSVCLILVRFFTNMENIW